MLKKLCFEEKIEFTEAMQFISESWKSFTAEEKKKYEVDPLAPKPTEVDPGPKGTRIKIKHTFENMGGLKLDGYVYFA